MSPSVVVQQLQILQAIPHILTPLLHVLHLVLLSLSLREAQPLLSLLLHLVLLARKRSPRSAPVANTSNGRAEAVYWCYLTSM